MKLNIYDILFWIFFVIALAMILWYIFGDSPAIEQALLVLIITFLFKIQSDISSNKFKVYDLNKRLSTLEKYFKDKILS